MPVENFGIVPTGTIQHEQDLRTRKRHSFSAILASKKITASHARAGVFPDEKLVLQLVTAIVMETSEE